jgi:hypothetical protein
MAVIRPYTKFACAKVIPDKRAITVAKAFREEVLLHHSCPFQIVTDQGGEFNADFKQLLQAEGLKHIKIRTRNPQANGQVERFMQTLKSTLRATCHRNRNDWEDKVPAVVFNYNTFYQEAIKSSPFILLYGRMPIISADHMYKSIYTARLDEATPFDWNSHVSRLQNLHNMQEQAKIQIEMAQAKEKENYARWNKKRRPRADNLTKGDYCLMQKPGRIRGFRLRWEGPYQFRGWIGPCHNQVAVLKDRRRQLWYRRAAEVIKFEPVENFVAEYITPLQTAAEARNHPSDPNEVPNSAREQSERREEEIDIRSPSPPLIPKIEFVSKTGPADVLSPAENSERPTIQENEENNGIRRSTRRKTPSMRTLLLYSTIKLTREASGKNPPSIGANRTDQPIAQTCIAHHVAVHGVRLIHFAKFLNHPEESAHLKLKLLRDVAKVPEKAVSISTNMSILSHFDLAIRCFQSMPSTSMVSQALQAQLRKIISENPDFQLVLHFSRQLSRNLETESQLENLTPGWLEYERWFISLGREGKSRPDLLEIIPKIPLPTTRLEKSLVNEGPYNVLYQFRHYFPNDQGGRNRLSIISDSKRFEDLITPFTCHAEILARQQPYAARQQLPPIKEKPLYPRVESDYPSTLTGSLSHLTGDLPKSEPQVQSSQGELKSSISQSNCSELSEAAHHLQIRSHLQTLRQLKQ